MAYAQDAHDFIEMCVVAVGHSGDMLGDSDILLGVQGRQQVEPLEHEADLGLAQLGPFRVGHVGQVVTIDLHRAARRGKHAPHDVEQGRLAGSGRSQQSDEFARLDFHRYATQGWHVHASKAVDLLEVRGLDQGVGRHVQLLLALTRRRGSRTDLPWPLSRRDRKLRRSNR